LLLPELPPPVAAELVERHLLNGREFDCQFPVPSVAQNDQAFNPGESRYLWRGPT